MLDPYTLLGMVAIIPLIEALDVLMEFAQRRNVFIQDFVATLKQCETKLLRLYADSATAFLTDEHHVFLSLQSLSHYDIHMKWDLADSEGGTHGKRLAFVVNGTLQHAVNSGKMVDEVTYVAIAKRIQTECCCKYLKPCSESYVAYCFKLLDCLLMTPK
jgi:hypothetical protein